MLPIAADRLKTYLMKRFIVLTANALALVFMSVSAGNAQRKPVNTGFIPYSTVSLGVGSSHYYGDLAGYRQLIRSTFIMPRWNAGIGYTRQFTPNFAARAMFTWVRIAGDDYTFNRNNLKNNLVQYGRNLHFRNDVKEFAITGLYNFVADGRNPNERAKLTPYVFAGLALIAHSPEARSPYQEGGTDSQRWTKLQPLHTEGQGQPGYAKPYSLVTLAIPAGVGVRYRLNESFNLAFEVGYRYTFTDYLDDAGGNYPADGVLTGLAAQMSDRRQEKYAARYLKPLKDRYQTLIDMYNSGSDEDRRAIGFALEENPVRGGKGLLRDGYITTSFQIQYVIPSRIKCPPIK